MLLREPELAEEGAWASESTGMSTVCSAPLPLPPELPPPPPPLLPLLPLLLMLALLASEMAMAPATFMDMGMPAMGPMPLRRMPSVSESISICGWWRSQGCGSACVLHDSRWGCAHVARKECD